MTRHSPLPLAARGRAVRRLLLVGALAATLGGCAGIDIVSVQRADSTATADAAVAIVTGRIRHVVDGQPMAYGALNRPHLQLYHQERRVLMSTPQTEADGSFRWRLPPGTYVLAAIYGGMAPTRQPMPLPDGSVIRVEAIVDPGFAVAIRPGRTADLGTLILDIESKPLTGVLFGGGPVFGRLKGVRAEPAGPEADQPALQRASPGGPGVALPAGPASPTTPAPAPSPAVLAPLLPLLIR